MKATFFERLSSYLIDTLIVSLIFSLICLGFGNYTSEAEKAMLELENKMLENSITMEEYLVEYKDILYDYQKENVLQSGISVALTIAYFVVFQYMNKGQTIGKKILNIRVVDKKSKKSISILKGLLRSFIVFSVVSGTCCILFLYIFNRDTYVISYSALLSLEAIFTIVTMILVLYKKDGRGLHDMMANTIVIKEKR
jgi:uncharacterized RDD family membrane protein YckC